MTLTLYARVLKSRGYLATGIVVSVFETLAGKTRYEVEFDQVPGVLMTYSDADLTLLDSAPTINPGDITNRGEVVSIFYDGTLWAVVRAGGEYIVCLLSELRPLEGK